MAVMVIIHWDGVGLEQYDEMRKVVRWELERPVGLLLHLASHDGQAVRIVDIWETAEDYQNFVENRLVPGMASLGLTREPLVEIYPAHAVYLPDNAPAD